VAHDRSVFEDPIANESEQGKKEWIRIFSESFYKDNPIENTSDEGLSAHTTVFDHVACNQNQPASPTR
jgi:hypothetical protein